MSIIQRKHIYNAIQICNTLSYQIVFAMAKDYKEQLNKLVEKKKKEIPTAQSDDAIKNIFETGAHAHCRFDAIARMYHYQIARSKNPFYFERAYYYPFAVNIDVLHEMAAALIHFTDFTSFSKKKTQVKSFACNTKSSRWIIEKNIWRYEITADRFLRGMVKGLVGTMLRLAKNNKDVSELKKIVETRNHAVADFSVPSDGLFLTAVVFNNDIIEK